jgi:hypothetical protein
MAHAIFMRYFFKDGRYQQYIKNGKEKCHANTEPICRCPSFGRCRARSNPSAWFATLLGKGRYNPSIFKRKEQLSLP